MGERLETTRSAEESILAVAKSVPPDEAYIASRPIEQIAWKHVAKPPAVCGKTGQSIDGRLIDLVNKGSAKIRCQCGQFIVLRRRLIVSK